jgi:hypothetical protein
MQNTVASYFLIKLNYSYLVSYGSGAKFVWKSYRSQ